MTPDGMAVELALRPVAKPSAIWNMYANGIFVCKSEGTLRKLRRLVLERSVLVPTVPDMKFGSKVALGVDVAWNEYQDPYMGLELPVEL